MALAFITFGYIERHGQKLGFSDEYIANLVSV
jgi:hypothetical protein